MVAGVICSSECREWFDYFLRIFFFSLWQTSLNDLPALLGHSANQWIATFIQFFRILPPRREREREKKVIFVSQNSDDWRVLRREQLEVRICQCWCTLSPGRIRRGLEQLEVQLGWMSSLWHCRLWQAPVLPQTGRIYGNGRRVLRGMGDDHCLSHPAIRWNPAGLNLEQMCPINLQVSLGCLMKTNRQTVKGTIDPASFPVL